MSELKFLDLEGVRQIKAHVAEDLSTKVDKTTTITAGNGLTGGGDLSNNRTISHADTSSVSNVTASGRKYITGLTFDGYGHVTGVTTGTEIVVDTDTGATKVSVTGSGNAITAASYDASTRTITLTKGATYNNYSLPVATSSALGGVKSGEDITVDSSGNVSVVDDSHTHSNSTITSLDASKLTGTVPTSVLPSYVDDVIEATSTSGFPLTGETGKIYVDTSSNKTYRWSGSQYTEISASLALGTTSSTAYRGDRGAAAYTHAVTNKGSAFASGLYKITTNNEGHVTAATAVAKADITGLGIPAQDTTYSAGTGISLSGTTINHSNSVTAGTAQGDANKTLTFGGTFTIPTVTYDAQGHVTGKGTTTMTMPSNPNVDTKVNVTLGTTTKAYLLGVSTTPTSTAKALTAISDTGVYLDTTAGKLTTTSLNINNTNTPVAISLNRPTINYIQAATDGASIALVANSVNGEANSALVVNQNSVIPGAANTYSLGTDSRPWANIVGDRLTGDHYGNGYNLTSLDANQLAYGTVPADRLPTASTSAQGAMTAAMVTKLNGIAAGADAVSFTQNLTSGEKIGTININGTNTEIFAPESGSMYGIHDGEGNVTLMIGDAENTATTITPEIIGAADRDHTHNDMTGATTSNAGTSGFVPAPAAGATNRFLRADGTWQEVNVDFDIPDLDYLPLTGGTVTGNVAITATTASTSTTTGALKVSGGVGIAGDVYANAVVGAVWNDYAETRKAYSEDFKYMKPGCVVTECAIENDTVRLTDRRLEKIPMVITDTYGFLIGEKEGDVVPIAVAGRVLVNTYEDREKFELGDAVCSGPNGTVSIMTYEELLTFPDRVLGYVSCIPDYDTWGEVKVNNRIWIKLK